MCLNGTVRARKCERQTRVRALLSCSSGAVSERAKMTGRAGKWIVNND